MSNTYNDNPGENENLGSAEEEQQLGSSQEGNYSDQDDNPMTHASEDENTDANEANAARNTVNSGSHNLATSYTDRNKSTTSRANEATSRNDTNTGGLGSGGGNSAGEIK